MAISSANIPACTTARTAPRRERWLPLRPRAARSIYFVQPNLFEDIANANNDYFVEKLEERAQGQQVKQVARERKRPGYKKKTVEAIKSELQSLPDITARELCVFIGLLVARAIAPNKEKLENHWRTTDEGGIPRGCFGKFLSRDRFMHVSRNLHFCSNAAPEARTDRAWKLRPVIDALQARFKAGYVAPPVMAFDEAMLPSRSSFNLMRVYLKGKPHKWGTKLFMLCCSTTAYRIRFEVYLGKTQPDDQVDTRSGAAAVIRNRRAVFGTSTSANASPDMRLVVTDRYYTSVALSMRLLTLGFYTIGTVMTNRLGLCPAIVDKRKKRPNNIDRGTFTVAEALQIPGMTMLCWWDNRPVHFLCTGGSVQMDRVARREKSGSQAEVACPRVIKDYQTYMGVVDVHDQLRLQRYSLQLSVKYKKYYKSLFLGFIDLAIINAFIVFNRRRVNDGHAKISHVKFLKMLHLELCQLGEDDWAALRDCQTYHATPTKSTARPSPRSAHVPVQNDEWREANNNQGRKRRTRACKACSLLKGTDNARGGDSSVYCGGCKLKTASKNPKSLRVFLWDKVRHAHNGVAMSCFDMWHKVWRNGTALPIVVNRSIRARTPARVAASGSEEEESKTEIDELNVRRAAGKRKRARCTSSDNDEEEERSDE